MCACHFFFFLACVVCNQSLFTSFHTPYTPVAQLKCISSHVAVRSPYSTLPPYTTESFHGMSISLHAGLMMAESESELSNGGPD